MDAKLAYASPQSADAAEKSSKNLFVLRASEVKTDSVRGNFVFFESIVRKSYFVSSGMTFLRNNSTDRSDSESDRSPKANWPTK